MYLFFCCSGNQQRANEKECILVIDRVTGEITLEKLSSQIRVKKTRQEKPDRHQQQFTQVPPDLNHWGDGEPNLLLNSGIFRRKLLRNEVTKLKYTQPGLQGSRLS